MYSLDYEGNKASDKRLGSYLKNEKSHKRTMIDRERYRKRNRNKMVSYRDKVGEKQRDRKRKDEREM